MKTATKTKTTVHGCARTASRPVVAAQPCPEIEPATRKLSARDSRMLVEYLSKPAKPNAALRAAARKYWHLV